MKQRIAILGSTGSVGANTLEVISLHPTAYEVFALTASTKVDLMLDQCRRFHPKYAVMASLEHGRLLADKVKETGLGTVVLAGPEAICEVASHESVDAVMAAIVGAAGLASCLAAALAGKRLLLANKEALVIGGDLFLEAVKQGGAKLLPIDSEHSAIFQSLPQDAQTWKDCVDKIILTASGGPFRNRDPKTFKDVTPEQACTHPNWSMGRKISVDSATMMNKALEVIEARYLFGLPADRIDVVIHPQSVIHSMVQYIDHSVVAQLGTPDMRVPIAYGLSWPKRMASGAHPLNFQNMSDMTFESIDSHGHPGRFPGLRLAKDALMSPQGTTAVLNAANEVAVEAFLNRQIRFDQIHVVNIRVLELHSPKPPGTLQDLLQIDMESRRLAQQCVEQLAL